MRLFSRQRRKTIQGVPMHTPTDPGPGSEDHDGIYTWLNQAETGGVIWLGKHDGSDRWLSFEVIGVGTLQRASDIAKAKGVL